MAPGLIQAQLNVRADGMVTAAVGGAVFRDASGVPMAQAKAVLTRYSAAYGPLLVSAVYADGRRLLAVLTPEGGMQPYTPAAPAPQPPLQVQVPAPAPREMAYAQPVQAYQPAMHTPPQQNWGSSPAQVVSAGSTDDLNDLVQRVESLPKISHTAVRGPVKPKYRAPGLEQIGAALHVSDMDPEQDPFAGVVPGAPHLRADGLTAGTPGNWADSNELPSVNIEEDIKQSLASGKGSSSRHIPRVPGRALKSAAIVGTLFSILAGLLIAKPWVEEAPAERPDRTVFEQLENGELQGG